MGADRAARDADIVRLRESGLTLEHIAGLYGVTRQRICQILTRNGVQGRLVRPPKLIECRHCHAIYLKGTYSLHVREPEHLDATRYGVVLRLYLAGVKLDEIAQTMGYNSTSTVGSMLEYLRRRGDLTVRRHAPRRPR